MKMEGEYLDGRILSVIQRYEAELRKEMSLGYAIKVKHQKVTLADLEIYPCLFLRLPKYFRKLEGDSKTPFQGYVLQGHPELLYVSDCGTVHFTFDTVEAGDNLPEDTRREMIKRMKSDYPQNAIYEAGEQEAEGMKIPWFEYRSYALDSDVYNIMFFLPDADQKIRVGTFKCPWRDAGDWHTYLLKILTTAKKEETNEGLSKNFD